MVKIQVDSQGKAYYTSDGKALLSSESGGGDKINIKNGRLYGNVSYNPTTGDATNFSNDDYMVDYFGGFNNRDFEVVFKFTTGNDVSSDAAQMVCNFPHFSENINTGSYDYFFQFEIWTGGFYGPYAIQGSWRFYKIFDIQPNTTYWVKIIFNYDTSGGWQYWKKEEGGDYQLVTTIGTGDDVFPNDIKINKIIIGNEVFMKAPFGGTVHLDECYIKSDDVIIWSGASVKIQQNQKVYFTKKINANLTSNLYIDPEYKALNFNTYNFIQAFKFPNSGSNFTFYGRFTYDGNTNIQCIYDSDISGGYWANIALRSGYLSICGKGTPTVALQAGKTYDFKCEWDGNTNWNQYIKEASSDTWILDTTFDNFSDGGNIFDHDFVLGIHKYNSTETFTGVMYLDKFKVTQNDTIIWKAVDDEYSIVSPNYLQYYQTGVATGNASSGLYEVSTVLG